MYGTEVLDRYLDCGLNERGHGRHDRIGKEHADFDRLTALDLTAPSGPDLKPLLKAAVANTMKASTKPCPMKNNLRISTPRSGLIRKGDTPVQPQGSLNGDTMVNRTPRDIKAGIFGELFQRL